MKLNKMINTLSIAAVALLATACNDTDAQYTITEVGAPEFTVSEPSVVDDVLLFGERTIRVAFDKKVGFATKNASQITLNGVPVKKALVYGADSIFTVVADVNFDRVQTLHIPAGLIIGPQHKAYDKDLDLTWEIKDLPDNEATQMTKKLGWGWNLGNHFDTSDVTWGYWDGATPTAALFQKLASYGAKTVRIPATWTCHMDATNTIAQSYLDEVGDVVSMAIDAGLNVILNSHHDSFETDLGYAASNPIEAKLDSTLIATLWTQGAEHFKNYNDQLIFEVFNEIHAGDIWDTCTDAESELLNKWNQYAVDAIRATKGNNATRWIGVAHYAANIDMTIEKLVLPTDAAHRIMVGVHCYDPYNFCLAPESSGVDSWGHNANPLSSVAGMNEDYILPQLYKLRKAYIEKGIPCYLGEYGCVWQTTDGANAFRKYYLEYFCRSAWTAGIPMMVWDNTGNDVSKGGNEANYYINHNNGEFVADGAEIIPMMIRACTDPDSNYWFYEIWDHSPNPAE